MNPRIVWMRPLVGSVGLSLMFVVAAAGFLIGVPPANAQDQQPAIAISPAQVSPGATINVELTGWPAGSAIVSVCSNGAARGDIDCDLLGQRATAIAADGTAKTRITVDPPGACPCVVRATTPHMDIQKTLAISVPERGSAPITNAATAAPGSTDLVIAARIVDAPGSLLAGFGAQTTQTLELTVRNNSDVVYDHLSATAGVGHDAASVSAIAVPDLEPLHPGEERTYDVPFTLAVPTIGQYVVVGSVDANGQVKPFRATTDHQPWALYLLVLVAVGVVVVRMTRRRRRARARSTADAAVAGIVGEQLDPGTIPVAATTVPQQAVPVDDDTDRRAPATAAGAVVPRHSAESSRGAPASTGFSGFPAQPWVTPS